MKSRKKEASLLRAIAYFGTLVTVLMLVSVVGYILIMGIPNITTDLFSWEYNSENVSLLPSLINTISMTFISLLIAVPLGIFAAVYLVEYAKKGNRFVKLVRLTTETLAGIPSIIYGLFGLLFFVSSAALNLGMSLISGALTLALMILPTIIRTTEEALLAVPESYREGSFGLGAGRLRTVFKVVMPSAKPGILAGIILAIGRIVGETAALIYTSGTVPKVATSVFDSARTLSVHMFVLSTEGLYSEQAYATAAVLLILVAGINALSAYVSKRVGRK